MTLQVARLARAKDRKAWDIMTLAEKRAVVDPLKGEKEAQRRIHFDNVDRFMAQFWNAVKKR
jgi:hypothetical protein